MTQISKEKLESWYEPKKMREVKIDLTGYKKAGFRQAYHPQKGLVNLTAEEYKKLK
jgi:malate synthase